MQGKITIYRLLINFENIAVFKYFGTAVTNKSCSHKELRSRVNSGLSPL
jgi:hypothetical protein